jgi:uncharacterized integral membrane protein
VHPPFHRERLRHGATPEPAISDSAMTKRLVGWFVLVPLCLVLVVFALANRQPVAVNFNPFEAPGAPAAGYGVPLFLVVYVVLLVGVLLGGVATWFAQGHHRTEKRRYQRRNAQLVSDLEVARRSAPQDLPDADLVNLP